MARDVDLVLDSGRTVIGDETVTAIDTEGGFFATCRVKLGAMTGGTSLRPRIFASVNNGVDYYSILEFPPLDANDDNIEIARPCYVPRPTTAGQKVKVQVRYDDTGGMTSVVTRVDLEPMVSLSPPAIDTLLVQGLELIAVGP